jgi:LPS-assembly protein
LRARRPICFCRVTRRLALIIALATACAPARAQPKAPPKAEARADLSSDSGISIDYTTGDLLAPTNARLVDTNLLLTADQIRYNQRTQVAVATGHVVLTRVGDRILADTVTYNGSDGTFTATNLRIGRFPYYIEGKTAEGNRDHVVVHEAIVTYNEPGKWQPTIHASSLTYSPGHYLRLSGGSVGIGSYRPIPVSRAGQDLSHHSSLTDVSFDGGYRRNLGAYTDTALNIPIADGMTAGPDLGIYTFRGVMLGPTSTYDMSDGDNSAMGYLKSGYIYDYGTRYTDILGNPVPPNRAYVEWHNDAQITDDFTITGDVNWSTDSEVIRDFHSKEFVPIQEPDNYLEAVYTSDNTFTSAFTRFQPDSFYPVQQRLPEIRFDVVPMAIGGGIYMRFNSGFAHLEDSPPDGGTYLEADRFDVFAGFTRPFSYKGMVDFTPVVGGRYTEYWDTEGATDPGGKGRALGELGFDADMKINAVFDYVNPLWGIDGLRHLLTPTLSYRYIPNGNEDSAWIPPIDRSTFTNYLPILELGDMRAVDQLQASNVLRLGIHNVLQTRDKTYGSRNLVTFDVDEDFLFQRAPGQTDFSDVHIDMVATPAHWLELRVEDTVSTERAAQRAIDSTVTVREGDVWSAGLGVGYLSDKYGTFFVPGLGYNPIIGVDTFHYEGRVRMNEEYDVFVRGDYDARDHLMVDQYYGFTQRVSNTWIVQYAVVFSQGLNDNQGHFGLEVNLNLVRF